MGMLSKHAACQISMSYSEGGTLEGLSFSMCTEYGHREFALPVRAAGVLAEMHKESSIPASKFTPEQATRVACESRGTRTRHRSPSSKRA